MKKAINQELMRSNNKKQILEFIQKSSAVSKREIADKLGLSLTSVSTFINELMNEKKIISCGTAKSTGGRRSALYQVNPDASYLIGLDLQIDRLIGVLLNFTGDLIGLKEVPYNNKDEWFVISLLNNLIFSLVQENGISPDKIEGIGIGVPGIVNSETGLIEFAPNLGWKNVDLRSFINTEKPVFIENEANAAALGEKTFGMAREIDNMVYVSVGMGVGCGLILGNRLFTGSSYQAGEFGHMTVEPEGRSCQCGNKGCWEVYASNDAALKLFKEKSGTELKHIEEFMDLVLTGNREALETLEMVVKYLGIGIANIVNGINPQMVVIGGKIAELRELVYNKLLKEVKERTLLKAFSGLKIDFSGLENRACALGAAGMVVDKIIAINL